MSGYVSVPQHARLVRVWRGSFEGDTLRVELWDGMASDGYKSDYERRPARWLACLRFAGDGKRTMRNVNRYGGHRYAQAEPDHAEIVAGLLAAGVVEIPAGVTT